MQNQGMDITPIIIVVIAFFGLWLVFKAIGKALDLLGSITRKSLESFGFCIHDWKDHNIGTKEVYSRCEKCGKETHGCKFGNHEWQVQSTQSFTHPHFTDGKITIERCFRCGQERRREGHSAQRRPSILAAHNPRGGSLQRWLLLAAIC